MPLGSLKIIKHITTFSDFAKIFSYGKINEQKLNILKEKKEQNCLKFSEYSAKLKNKCNQI